MSKLWKNFLARTLFRIGAVAAVVVAVLAVRFYRPEYDFIDILVILAVGMIAGAIYVRGQDWITRSLRRREEKPDKQTAVPKPSSQAGAAG